jgi:hypothetical protein
MTDRDAEKKFGPVDLRTYILQHLKHSYYTAKTDEVALKNGVVPNLDYALPTLENKADTIMERIREEMHTIIGPHEKRPEGSGNSARVRKVNSRNAFRHELHNKVNTV